MALSARKLGIAAVAFATALNLSPANDSFVSHAEAQATSAKLPSQMSVGSCISKDAMLSGLNAEGQYILLVATAKYVDNKSGALILGKEVFTANNEYSKGYHLAANIKGDYCKIANTSEIKLLNALTGHIDPRAFKVNMPRTGSGNVNTALLSAYKQDQTLPMLQFNVNATDNADIKYTITVTANQSGEGGVMIAFADGRLNMSPNSDKNVLWASIIDDHNSRSDIYSSSKPSLVYAIQDVKYAPAAMAVLRPTNLAMQ